MTNTFITPEEFAKRVLTLIRENAKKFSVSEVELANAVGCSWFNGPTLK